MAGLLNYGHNQNVSNETIRQAIANAKSSDEVFNLANQYKIGRNQIVDAMQGQHGYTGEAIDSYLSSRQTASSPSIGGSKNSTTSQPRTAQNTGGIGGSKAGTSPTSTRVGRIGSSGAKSSGLLRSTPSQGYISGNAGVQSTPLLTNNRGSLFNKGQSGYSGQEIRDFILTPGRTQDDIINQAMNLGVSVDEIADAMRGYQDFDISNITHALNNRGIINPDQSIVDRQRRERELGVPNRQPINYSAYAPTFAAPSIATQDLQRGTVAGQLNTILNPNSALMQRAQTFANQRSNARGLLNSSIGTSAAQGAMIDRALPIATADAASANQFELANSQNRQQINMFNSDMARQYDLTKLGITKDMAINAENIARDYGLAHIDVENKIRLADINLASKSSSDAAALNDRLLSGITTINQQDISQEAKDQQIATLVKATDDAIAMLGAFDRVTSGSRSSATTNDAAQSSTPENDTVQTTTDGQPTTDNTPPITTQVMTQGGFPLTGDEAKNAQRLRDLGHEFDESKIVTKAEMKKIRDRDPKFGKYLLEMWLEENAIALSLPNGGNTRGPGPVTFVRIK